MVHHRVADDDRLDDFRRCHTGLVRQRLGQIAQSLAHNARHLDIAARVHHDIGDAAHQIFAKADLRVHQAGGGQHRSIRQRDEMARDGRRAQINCQPVERGFAQAGEQRNEAGGLLRIALPDRSRDLPVALAQHRLELRHHRKIGLQAFDPESVFQSGGEALEIAQRFVHIGFGHIDEVNPHRRIHLHHPLGGGFADHLLMHLGFGRHVEHHIALDAGLAAQPTPCLQPAHAIIALFHRIDRRQRICSDRHAMFGELPLPDRHLAFRADPPPAADRIEINPHLPRGLQHTRPFGDAGAFARRGENYEGIIHGALQSCASRILGCAHGKSTHHRDLSHLSCGIGETTRETLGENFGQKSCAWEALRAFPASRLRGGASACRWRLSR